MGKKIAKTKHDVAFEIKFFEKVLEHSPNFVQALIVLGDLYTKNGLHQDGLRVDERLSALRPLDPFVFYNLACSYSLVGNVDKSLSTLKKAIVCGYDDFDHLMRDSDLHNLREDARFKDFLSTTQNQKTTP